MFNRLLYCLFFLFTSICILTANDGGGYNIISHRAFIKLYPAENRIVINDTVKIRFIENHKNELVLTFNPSMIVSSVIVQGKKSKFEQKQEFLKIYFSGKEEFELIINYSGSISNRTEFSRFNESSAVLHESEILPLGTKSYDYIRFSIQAPSNWMVIAVGELVYRSTLSDSSLTIYENIEKVQTLGWICGGEYITQTSIADSITLSTFLFKEDSSFSQDILDQLHQAIKFYSEIFSKYRFKKLAIVEVDNWVAGKSVLAAAYPSVILIKKQAFQKEDRFNNIATILPHEVAHQWWPLTVFIEDEDAALLSEGLCEYSSVLFSEWTGLALARDSLKSHPLLRSLVVRASKGKDLPLKQKADIRSMPTHYLKGAYVHNMLRLIIGDSAFYNLLLRYTKLFSIKISSSLDYQKLAEQVSNKKLDWFFKQWTEHTGIPRLKIYNVKTKQLKGVWKTQGRVRLVGYEKKYTTPVEVGIVTDEGLKTQLVWVGEDSNKMYHNEVTFEVETIEKPKRALLDPAGKILKYQKLPPKLIDLLEPAEGLMIVGTITNTGHLFEIARQDSVELDRAGWWVRIKSDTAVTLADLQNDRVFIYGKISENRIAYDLVAKFPIRVVGNTVTIEGKSYYDSLAVIQIIENPYLDQGLMCWVAPLSEHADPHLMLYDASYVVIDGKEIVDKGTWKIKDEELEIEIK